MVGGQAKASFSRGCNGGGWKGEWGGCSRLEANGLGGHGQAKVWAVCKAEEWSQWQAKVRPGWAKGGWANGWLGAWVGVGFACSLNVFECLGIVNVVLV